MEDELISGLLKLSLRVSIMEKEIGMPLNSLSSILKKTKPFPPKWIKPIEEYLSRKNSAVSCVAGCKNFTGGEVKHHPDCPFYPESFSKGYDELVEKLKECESKANPAPKPEKRIEPPQDKKEGPKEAAIAVKSFRSPKEINLIIQNVTQKEVLEDLKSELELSGEIYGTKKKEFLNRIEFKLKRL